MTYTIEIGSNLLYGSITTKQTKPLRTENMKRLKTVKLMAISDNGEIGNEDKITILTEKGNEELFFDLKEQIQSFKKQQMDDVYCNLYVSITSEVFYKFPYGL